MSSVSYSSIYPMVYTYLGYRKIERNDEIDQIIKESLQELEEMNSFQYIYQEFDVVLDVLQKKPYLEYLYGSTGYYLSAMTLGSVVDQRIHYYEKRDFLRMCVFDATASAYLEFKSDAFEATLGEDLGFRFCPGYGGTDVSDIRPMYTLLKANKIGITLLDSNLMIPQKSMIGIVGIHNQKKKSCGTCMLMGDCKYREEGRTCYTTK